MYISALCMVKNEAKNLPRWLANMKYVADELVVVDTGSVDESVTIAQNSGARVVSYVWRDDFAAARNFALKQIRGDVVIFLDADEYFPDSLLKKLRLIISQLNSKPQVAGLCAPRVDIDVESETDQFIEVSVQCRIFRRGCTYQGSIHETLQIPEGMELLQDDRLLFYHTGYSASLIKGKLKRNLQMLLKRQERSDYEMQPMDYRYLMDCYYGLGEYEKALAMSEKCLQFSDKLAGLISYIHKIRVKAAYSAGLPAEKITEMIQEALQAGDRAYFLQLMGHYLWEQGERQKALSYVEAGLEATENMSPVSPVYELLPYSLMMQGESMVERGEVQAGLKVLTKAVQEFPHVPLLQKSLLRAQTYCLEQEKNILSRNNNNE